MAPDNLELLFRLLEGIYLWWTGEVKKSIGADGGV